MTAFGMRSVSSTTNEYSVELLAILQTMSLQEIADDVPSGMLQLIYSC